MALRLARYFGTMPRLWLNSQRTWELHRAEIEKDREIAERVRLRPRRRHGRVETEADPSLPVFSQGALRSSLKPRRTSFWRAVQRTET